MLVEHRTKEGDVILIAQMSDDHLSNMIRFICKRIKQIRESAEVTEITDQYTQTLYGLSPIDAETAAETNRLAIEKLYPYLAEAFLRGLYDLRYDVTEAIGRAGVLTNNQNLLTESDDEIPF